MLSVGSLLDIFSRSHGKLIGNGNLLLSAQTDHTIQSLLYFKNNYQTQQKHKNFSTEFFHLILNKYLGCALINEHNLVIVKTNQNKN
jgi:hypothetical protein